MNDGWHIVNWLGTLAWESVGWEKVNFVQKNYHFVHHHRSASWSIVLQLQPPLDIYSSSDDDDDHPGAIMQDVDLKNKILELPPIEKN